MIYWIVKIGVDETLIVDGFDLTEKRLKDMVLSDLLYAYYEEIDTQIIEKPSKKLIDKIQREGIGR